MVTAVTLGNYFTVDGKSVLGGAGGSGLDTQSIISALVTAKQQPATDDQTQLTANGKITSALNQFQQLLSTFQTSAQALSNPPGIGNEANNVFDFTTANVGNGGSSYVSVTAQPGTPLQSYNISNISSLATAASQTTGVFTVASADASVVSANPISGSQYQFAPGTITLPQNFSVSQFATGTAGTGSVTAIVNSLGNLQVGDNVTISGASGTLDGITAGQINGTQTITAIDTTNNTITFSTAGTSTTGGVSGTEGGDAQVESTQTLTLNEGDSLNTVVNDFNAISATTGIAASIIQLSSDQFQLSFNSTNTGSANSFNLANDTTISSDPSGVFGNVGLTEQQSTGTFTIASPSAEVASSSDITGTTGIQFTPGSYTVNGQTVTINEGDSLTQVAADFNNVSGTGITAHVVQVGTNQYQLEFTQNPGAADLSTLSLASTFSSVDVGSKVNGTTATAGTDASFEINGITVTRPTNAISDVVSGLTFNLLQQTPDDSTVYPVSIAADTTTIQNTIVSFVNAYNAVLSFAAQQTQLTSSGTYASAAILANNTAFRQTMSDLTDEVTSAVSGLSGSITSLNDVGITLTNQAATSTTPVVNNILTVNDGELSSALSTNFQGVKNLFGLNLTSNNPNLEVFSNPTTLGLQGFTLTINPDTNTFQAVNGSTTINLTAQSLGTGYSLTGPAGSALAGLVLIYGSNSAATISVGITQGVADASYNSVNAATAANTGSLAVALTGIQTNDTTLNNDITTINAQVSQYQQQLLQQYAALESAISSVNTVLTSLNANSVAAQEEANIG